MKKITTLSVGALASAMLLVTGCSTNNGNQETAAQSISITEQSSANEKVGYSLGYMMAEVPPCVSIKGSLRYIMPNFPAAND